MNNNLAEIKILITGLLQDIESLENTETLPLYKWEDIMISLDIIKHKLNTHKFELERITLKELAARIEQISSEENYSSDSIQDFEPEPETDTDTEPDSEPEPEKFPTKKPDIIKEQIKREVPFIEPVKPVVSRRDNIFAGDLFVEPPKEEEFELFDDTAETILDAAMRVKPNWKKDLPGTRISDINDGITFNDKIVFLNDLFYGDTDQYRLSISRLNELKSLNEAVDYLRTAFPDWDEASDTVYRFYMIIRRKLDV